jgi:hypothetical protein
MTIEILIIKYWKLVRFMFIKQLSHRQLAGIPIQFIVNVTEPIYVEVSNMKSSARQRAVHVVDWQKSRQFVRMAWIVQQLAIYVTLKLSLIDVKKPVIYAKILSRLNSLQYPLLL